MSNREAGSTALATGDARAIYDGTATWPATVGNRPTKAEAAFAECLPYGVIVSRTYDPNKPQILQANRARAERIELGGRPVLWDGWGEVAWT